MFYSLPVLESLFVRQSHFSCAHIHLMLYYYLSAVNKIFHLHVRTIHVCSTEFVVDHIHEQCLLGHSASLIQQNPYFIHNNENSCLKQITRQCEKSSCLVCHVMVNRIPTTVQMYIM